jgi:hypothetical protein
LRLEAVDLLDLLVEELDLVAQRVVAALLRIDHRVHHQQTRAVHDRGADHRPDHADTKGLLAFRALLFAPRQ